MITTLILVTTIEIWGFRAGGGPWTDNLYGPFNSLNECQLGRQIIIERTNHFWFNKWTVLECKRIK